MVRVRIDRITTRGGDKGKTSLANARRVPKDSLRIEAMGAVDEANAALGLLQSVFAEDEAGAAFVRGLENDLFDLGADLAFPETAGDTKPRIRLREEQVAALETAIAERNRDLAPLRSFILPGGSAVAAAAHLARAIVRRAERRVVALAAAEPLNPTILRYLNRLSDLLFVLARQDNERHGATLLWQPSDPAAERS